MTPAQKAIMEKAKRDGVLPMELAANLIVHDMVEATRAQMTRYEVGYNKMTEKQQDAVLGDLQSAYTGMAEIIARVIASGGASTVTMTLKDLKVSNGTLTGAVKSDEKHFNELISKVQDKSDVLIVLYEREYSDGLDAIQSEKDQKALPLDDESAPATKPKAAKKGDKPGSAAAEAKKPATFTPAQHDAALEFVTKQQNCTHAGLQNQLKIGYDKAEAILAALEDEGVLTSDDNGNRIINRKPKVEGEAAKPATTKEVPAHTPELVDPGKLTEEIYQNVGAYIIHKQEVSPASIAVALELSDEVVKQAIDRLEMEGVISDEDDFGRREVYGQ